MKFNFTNEKVLNYVLILKKQYADLLKYDKRFNFAVSRTISNLQPIAKEVFKLSETNVERFKEYEQKKEQLVKSIAMEVNDAGIPHFESVEDGERCKAEVAKLNEEYNDALVERQKEIDNFNEILNEEVEVDIVQCRFEALPYGFDFNTLRELVKETDEEIEELI
jgi:hypothetical protein